MTEENEKDADALHEMVKVTADKLGEHFDSVIVIATKDYNYSGNYVRFSSNSGSYHASLGAVHEYLACQDERARIIQRKKDQ